MESEISKQVILIMEREMGGAGASIMERQCRHLGLVPGDLRPEHLPQLAGCLSEVMRVMGGTQKANRVYQEIKKLADLDRVAEMAQTDGSRLSMFEDLAKASMYSGDWDKATFYFKKLLHNAEVRKDRSGMAKYLVWIGLVHKERSDLESAIDYYRRGLMFAEASKDADQVSNCHHRLGDVQWVRGEYAEALKSYQRAIDLAKDRRSKGAAEVGIGNILVSRNDLEGATEHYNLALGLLDGTDDYLDIARAHNNLGDVNLQKGEWDAALACFKRGAEFAEMGGWLNIKAFTQFNAATALVAKGLYSEARDMLEKSLEILTIIDSKSGLGGAHHTYAKLCYAQGDMAGMVAHYKTAVELYKQAKIPFYTAQCIYELGLGHIKMDDLDSARAEMREAASIYSSIGMGELAKKALSAVK